MTFEQLAQATALAQRLADLKHLHYAASSGDTCKLQIDNYDDVTLPEDIACSVIDREIKRAEDELAALGVADSMHDMVPT